MQIEVNVTAEDHLEYLVLGNILRGDLAKRAKRDKLIFVSLIGSLGATLCYINQVPVGLAMIGISLFIIVSYDKILFKRHINYYRKQLQSTYGDQAFLVRFDFNDENINYKDENESGTILYDKIHKITSSERNLLLWTSQHHAMILPKDQIDNLEGLEQILEAKGFTIEAHTTAELIN